MTGRMKRMKALRLYKTLQSGEAPAIRPAHIGVRHKGITKERSMPDQAATPQSTAASPPPRRGLRPTWIVMLVAAAGLTGAVASTAFSQGFGPGLAHHFSPWRGGMMGQVFDPARAEEHADRMVRHLAIELDASNEQTEKLRGIVKS